MSVSTFPARFTSKFSVSHSIDPVPCKEQVLNRSMDGWKRKEPGETDNQEWTPWVWSGGESVLICTRAQRIQAGSGGEGSGHATGGPSTPVWVPAAMHRWIPSFPDSGEPTCLPLISHICFLNSLLDGFSPWRFYVV